MPRRPTRGSAAFCASSSRSREWACPGPASSTRGSRSGSSSAPGPCPPSASRPCGTTCSSRSLSSCVSLVPSDTTACPAGSAALARSTVAPDQKKLFAGKSTATVTVRPPSDVERDEAHARGPCIARRVEELHRPGVRVRNEPADRGREGRAALEVLHRQRSARVGERNMDRRRAGVLAVVRVLASADRPVDDDGPRRDDDRRRRCAVDRASRPRDAAQPRLRAPSTPAAFAASFEGSPHCRCCVPCDRSRAHLTRTAGGG